MNKKVYHPPLLEVFEVTVEQGFAQSGVPSPLGFPAGWGDDEIL